MSAWQSQEKNPMSDWGKYAHKDVDNVVISIFILSCLKLGSMEVFLAC